MAPYSGQKTIFLHELYQRRQARQADGFRMIDIVGGGQASMRIHHGLCERASRRGLAHLRHWLRLSALAYEQYVSPHLCVFGQRLQERWESWQWQRQFGERRYGPAKLAGVFAMALLISYVGVNYQALAVRAGYWWGGQSRVAEASKLEERLFDGTAETELRYIPRSTKLESVAIPIAPSDDRIIIPRLGINVPLVHTVGLGERQVMHDLEQGVAHLANTAFPGEVGNVFITGHSSYYPWATGDYKTVFALLDKLQTGDKIALYRRGEKFIYRVAGQQVVASDDLAVLMQRSDQRKLTLMTCYPIGTNSKRLIVDAYQVIGAGKGEAA